MDGGQDAERGVFPCGEVVLFEEACFKEFLLGQGQDDVEGETEPKRRAAGDKVAACGEGADELEFTAVGFHMGFQIPQRSLKPWRDCEEFGIRPSGAAVGTVAGEGNEVNRFQHSQSLTVLVLTARTKVCRFLRRSETLEASVRAFGAVRERTLKNRFQPARNRSAGAYLSCREQVLGKKLDVFAHFPNFGTQPIPLTPRHVFLLRYRSQKPGY